MSCERRVLWCTRPDGEGSCARIYGELRLPTVSEGASRQASWPTALLLHPFGAAHRFMGPYAEKLASSGFVTYNIDFCGGSRWSKSDKTMLEMSVETEALDVEATLEQIVKEPFCDQDNVFVVGASQGGAAAIKALSRTGVKVRAVVLLYPALSLYDDLRERFPSREKVPESFEHVGFTVGARYALDALGCDPFSEISSYQGDVLILHGDADELVPVEYSKRAAEVLPHATLEIVEGATHGFGDEQTFDWSLDRVRDYLRSECGRIG